MLCSGCGKDIPYVGDVCPYCQRDKRADQRQHSNALGLGLSGAILGYVAYGFPGALTGGVIGLLIAAWVGRTGMKGGTAPPEVRMVPTMTAPARSDAFALNLEPNRPPREALVHGECRDGPRSLYEDRSQTEVTASTTARFTFEITDGSHGHADSEGELRAALLEGSMDLGGLILDRELGEWMPTVQHPLVHHLREAASRLERARSSLVAHERDQRRRRPIKWAIGAALIAIVLWLPAGVGSGKGAGSGASGASDAATPARGSRTSAADEMCKDWVYYRAKVYKHTREGDAEAAANASATLSEVIADLAAHGPDVSQTCAAFDTQENLAKYMR